MSKKHQMNGGPSKGGQNTGPIGERPPAPHGSGVPPRADAVTPAPVESKSATPKHRQCPLCYGGLGGVGRPGWWRRINGTLVKRQYKCDQCGHDWTAEVRTHTVIERIEYTDVRVVSQDVNLEER